MNSSFEFLSELLPEAVQIGKDAESCKSTNPDKCICLLSAVFDLVLKQIFILKNGVEGEIPAEEYRDISALPEEIQGVASNITALITNDDLSFQENVDALLQDLLSFCHWFKDNYNNFAERNETAIEEDPIFSYSDKLDIDLKSVSVINYALYHNNIQSIQSITIHNNSPLPLESFTLKLSSEPEFLVPFTTPLDYIPENKSFEIKNPQIHLNSEFMASLTERIKGDVIVTLVKGNKAVAQKRFEITALAFDEWHGYSYYPELLTAFVTPNHPVLVPILARAAELLKSWTDDPSMDAYQTKDPNRVLKQAAAIFNALKEQNIIYSVPPASFEQVGQRVRLCDTVLQQKFGTCLDLTLLYVACLEAIGLHPVMIITKGHIFSGVWLDELSFPEAVQDDASLLTKRLADGVNEIAVIETTLAVNGKTASFDDARTYAEHELVGTEPVECIIDVFRARISGIVPLPQRILTDSGWTITTDTASSDNKNSAEVPRGVHEFSDDGTFASGENIPKVMQWERKLLDLGLRNNLINLRFSKTLVPLLTSSLDDLEDALSDGSDFSVLAKPSDWAVSAKDIDFETTHDLGEYTAVIKAEFANKRLRSILSETELSNTMKGLYRTSKTALEENGANTLYLALGVLRWYETERSSKPRYAPIVLMPVEIIRKSANKGFIIRLRDDEPQMNITMLEKIKQDFSITVSGVDPLPCDEHGIDLRRVFTIMRKAIMEQPRWDVLESAYLGIFSFSQFVMWNDLRNRTDDLMKNKIVKSLVEGKLCWDAQPMEIADRVPEDNVLLPVSADASQLYAIEAACSGESFVLHGPPGTGKSQTITSLIANALAQGKSVLFVAEKMAALEVVQKRLENIGIGPFCLELHSNNSKKKNVLEQLRRASEVTKKHTAEEYASKAQQTKALRSELDSYAQHLHTKLLCGYNLYELVNEYENFSNAPVIDAFSADYVKTLTKSDLDNQLTVLERLIAAAKAINHPFGHPLNPIGRCLYNQQLRTDMPNALTAYKNELTESCDCFKSFADEINFGQILGFSDVQKLYETAKALQNWFILPSQWAKIDNLNLFLSEIKDMAEHYIKAAEIRKNLLSKWHDIFLQQDGEQLLARYNQISAGWVLSKIAGMRSFTRSLSAYSKIGLSSAEIAPSLTMLCSYQKHFNAGEALFEKHGAYLGNLYVGTDTDWNEIIRLAAIAKESDAALIEATGSVSLRTSLEIGNALEQNSKMLIEKFTALSDAKNACFSLLEIDDAYAQNDWFASQTELCDTLLLNKDMLKEWLSFNTVAADAQKAGLGKIVAAYKAGIAHEDIIPAYRKAVLYLLITTAIDENDVLNTFSGAVFNEKIEQFKRLDREITQLVQKEIYYRLASRIPNFVSAASQSSELGILQRMIKSHGRGTSIRKLFEDIPNLLPRLCPCMLMSPISAAQYLDPRREPFDIVIFDEASQLPTCKAVGVLARGKDAVIVGDPKQMPPTSFFSTNTVDEDNLDIEDLESILDDCLAINMPQTHLLWHYRSRHESLIAFSNSQFYENKLLTFPSVNDREKKVSLVHIDGLFDRGKARTNRAEAEAVVNELKRRCHDEKLSSYSVGVVTFNISQQHLIDDLLTEACTADSELEKWIYESEEPLFVKNLENVQGDERDVILFSIGYGPDQNGKVSMNFGPLNRDGGWRRLNVAISRSRVEMIVFSTLTPDQINLSRTNSEGVAALKAFLEYADGQAQTLDENTVEQYRHAKDGIINSICQAINSEGFETDTHVGNSEYKIDIGVCSKRNPEKYMLGILLDGDCYGSSKTTRDREIAQTSVLNGLGWEIMRIWTMDWWDNSQKEINTILARLSELQAIENADADSDDNATTQSLDPELVEIIPPEEIDTYIDSEDYAEVFDAYLVTDDIPTTELDVVLPPDTAVKEIESAPTLTLPVKESTSDITNGDTIILPVQTAGLIEESEKEAPQEALIETEYVSEDNTLLPYSITVLNNTPLSTDEFISPVHRHNIINTTKAIIENEGPIVESLLAKRLLQSFGISRTSTKISSYMANILSEFRLSSTEINGIKIYWADSQIPKDYKAVRFPDSDKGKRDIKEIPSPEIINAICAALNRHFALSEENLIREASKLMGFARVTPAITETFTALILEAQNQNKIKQGQNNNWIIA